MNEHNQDKNIKDEILRKIEAHELSMRPKVYFTLKVVVFTLLAFAVLVVTVFIFNFILFFFRLNSLAMLPGFGARGFIAFIRFFPWEFLLLDILLIFALQWVVRKFRFGYKTPTLYVLGGLVVVTALCGFIIDRGTYFNDFLLHRADEQRLPMPFGKMYMQARHSLQTSGICRCLIVAINGNIVTVKDFDGSLPYTIVLPENSRRATTTYLKIGDRVFIAADVKSGVIHAFGLKKISTETVWPRRLLQTSQ